MKKITFAIVTSLFLGVSSSSSASYYWDCDTTVEEPNWLDYGYAFSADREVRADSRSDARYQAMRGGYVSKPGFMGFGSSSVYVCSAGSKKENGETCNYRFLRAECRRQ